MKENVEKLNEEDVVNISDWKNQPVYNVLDSGRYPCEVIELGKSVSGKGNGQFVVELLVNGDKKLTKYFVITDVDKKPHKMAFKWSNFLYCLGLRDPRQNVAFSVKNIVNKKCLCDVAKTEDGEDSQGNKFYKNEIRGFSPIEEKEQTAPVADVPSENAEEEKI